MYWYSITKEDAEKTLSEYFMRTENSFHQFGTFSRQAYYKQIFNVAPAEYKHFMISNKKKII